PRRPGPPPPGASRAPAPPPPPASRAESSFVRPPRGAARAPRRSRSVLERPARRGAAPTRGRARPTAHVPPLSAAHPPPTPALGRLGGRGGAARRGRPRRCLRRAPRRARAGGVDRKSVV